MKIIHYFFIIKNKAYLYIVGYIYIHNMCMCVFINYSMHRTIFFHMYNSILCSFKVFFFFGKGIEIKTLCYKFVRQYVTDIIIIYNRE